MRKGLLGIDLCRTIIRVLTLGEDYVKLSAARPVAIARLQINRAVPLHGHRFHELSVVESGSATHIVRGLEFPIGPGTIVMAEAGAVHAYTDVDLLKKRNLYFSTDWLAAELWPEPFKTDTPLNSEYDLVPEAIVLEPSTSTAMTIADELDDIEEELSRDTLSQSLLRACVLKILVHVSRTVSPGGSHGFIRTRPELWSTLRSIEALAVAGAPLDRRDLAKRIGLAPDTLNRLVRSETGCSLTDLYQRARIRRACRILTESNSVTLTEVAHRLGYSDGAHFHRHFSKKMGMSPSEWRKSPMSSE